VTEQAPLSVRARGPAGRWGVAALLVAFVYFLTFLAIREQPLLSHLEAVARNLVSLLLAAAAARAAIRRWIAPLTGAPAWLAHAAAALAFSLLWYWLLSIAAAMFDAQSALRFSVNPFLRHEAGGWQFLQGLFAYAALAALTLLELRPAQGGIIVVNGSASSPEDRFLLRGGEDVVTLPAADIVSITSADDYSELVTVSGRHLVATTLAEFEGLLDARRFARVHRSAIANLDHMLRAEPAGGGRMILRMREGPDLPVSRSGAKLLRERAL
jgi:hypothetical protein